jgi:predicted GNAT superfamily acetyltransferase
MSDGAWARPIDEPFEGWPRAAQDATLTAVRRSSRTPAEYTVRPARADDLPAAQRLVADAFGFSPLEVFPAWEMALVATNGGVALVAADETGVLGFSYAFPAYTRELGPYLYSNALVVDPSRAGLGIGRSLKLEQRRRASIAGYRLIRWTTDALSSRNLHLYLTRLGAHVTGVLPEFMRGLLEMPLDQLRIDWDLRSPAPGRHAPPTLDGCVVLARSAAAPDTWSDRVARARRAGGWALELPWALGGRGAPSAGLAASWRHAIGSCAQRLIADGYVGDAVVTDHHERASFLRFTRHDA